MAPELTPESVRSTEFRTSMRGFDREEVRAVLDEVAARLEALEDERAKLAARAQSQPGRDLEAEFDQVGRDVASILQEARDAADAMRERAGLDAVRWRREAAEEVETARREALADAEALRRDAWVTGTDMLQSASTEAEAMRAGAERDVLTVMGEAERDAHRLTSSSRRESEDLVRSASMEAERIMAEANARRDEIINGANRQAASAQERARALEQRRDELLEELENVRSTLTRLEGSLEERREALDLAATEPSSVKVVHPPAEAKRDWELGETVRVVPGPERVRPGAGDEMADDVSDDVARLQDSGRSEPAASPQIESDSRPEPEPSPQPEADAMTQPETVSGPEGEGDELDSPSDKAAATAAPESAPVEEPSVPAPQAEGPDTGLDELFASLRELRQEVAEDRAAPQRPAEQEAAEVDVVDWIEVREEKLVPIANRALRGVRKSITDVQNVALDSLRTSEDWGPDPDQIAALVHANLVAAWAESFAAGHAVAEQMTGSKLKRPKTPESKADTDFAMDLAAAVADALEAAGEGSRARQSALSRVFRVWRSDEAERRIRDIALAAYESGIELSRKVSVDG